MKTDKCATFPCYVQILTSHSPRNQWNKKKTPALKSYMVIELLTLSTYQVVIRQNYYTQHFLYPEIRYVFVFERETERERGERGRERGGLVLLYIHVRRSNSRREVMVLLGGGGGGLGEFFFWTRPHCRGRVANVDLCSSLMVIDQWGFFGVPHLLWHGASVYNGHLRGPNSRLAVELSLPVLTSGVCGGWDTNT